VTEPTNAAGVINALSAVMNELPAIGKGDKSPEGYQYRGIEAITKHLQPLLAKYGVIIVPKATLLNVTPSPAMKDGWQDVYITVVWNIYGPDGSMIEASTNGIGRDRTDKGANKAQTQAFKYLLLHLLSIADKADDADGLTYEDDRYEYEPAAPPTYSPEIEAFWTERLGPHAKDEIGEAVRAFAKENGRDLTKGALSSDPKFLEQVRDIIERMEKEPA